ncbi:PhnE/PtxC family ABC transporter permease [[Mycoplasma] gypis]|uniref:ABC transporter permease subunit n=1 Tax=[Mycoplasma] gypis TaxID=92404 RepID=A0ABZ2RNW9_9BACT|nr:ABC transporter permease subunit [[Mycoplasma] gypis]MBN0919595.1 ABC transporter permease subunit [[Mycoplasma] gypis]
MNKITNLFYYQYESSKNKTTKKIRPFWKHLFLIALIALIIYIFTLNNYSLNSEYGFDIFKTNIKRLFQFSNVSTESGHGNLIHKTLSLLFQTLTFALTGSFLGFLFAIITSSLTCKNYTNKFWSFISRNLILLLRSVPELVFITVFSTVFYSGLALIMIFMWFSWLWLHKYFIESIDNLDTRHYYISLSQGNSKFKAFTKEVLPRLLNRFISLFLYSFESNMRWASLLATLGAPGIGILIKYGGSTSRHFSELGIPLAVLLLVIITLELINILMNKYVFEFNSKTLKTYDYKKLAKTIDWRFWIKILLFIFVVIVSFYTIFTTTFKTFPSEYINSFFKEIFNPNWKVFDLNSSLISKNPILMLIQALFMSVFILVLSFGIVLLIIPFANKKTSNIFVVFIVRILNSVIRLIPVIVLFYIFSPVFNSYGSLILIILAIHSSSSITKQLSEIIDSVDEEVITNLKMQGWSRFRIYIRYILPTIKLDLISYAVFYFEMAFRNVITYSAVIGQDFNLGYNMYNFLQPKSNNIGNAAAYFWIITLTIFSINILSEKIVDKYVKNKKPNFKTIIYTNQYFKALITRK